MIRPTRSHRFLIAMRLIPSCLLVLISLTDFAGAQNLEAIADREIVRRQEDLALADQFAERGAKAMAAKDYESAYVNYLDAIERVPAGSATASQRGPLLRKFSDAGLAYANFLVENGRYGEAERVAKTILLPQFNPNYKPAVEFLSRLEQPDYFNKTVTPQFAADRNEVSKLLAEADGFYATGRYDLAIKRYEQVLNIDRYNSAARMGMERVNNAKSQYYGTAYNETRSRMLWMVDRSWERPVRRFEGRDGAGVDVRANGTSTTEAITAKLNRIIIPKIDLRDATVREAVEFLKQRSRDLDNTTEDPNQRRGVNIVLKLPADAAPAPAVDGTIPADPAAAPAGPVVTESSRVTLSLNNVPLIEALRYLTELAGLKYKIEPFAVSIVPVTENTDDLVTKEYRVPPGFIPSRSAADAASGSLPVAGGGAATVADARLGGRTDALEFLKSQGVPFPTGSFAQYVPAGSRLIVRNTQSAIDTIDFIVDAASGTQPTQVEIESKFLEITQNNLKELGFNWLLGPLAIGDGVYAAGGTEGAGQPLNSSTYPFGAGGTAVGRNPVTGGLRSGRGTSPDAAVTANSIDALLAGVTPGAIATAPGIFGLSGIFSNAQFQVVIRALNQQKGVDLMSAPKVTTQSGKKAVIKVVRNFPYPTEFEPPQPPNVQNGTSLTIRSLGFISDGIVTPTTPTAFETRDIGVTLEVEPQVGPDNYTIDLNLSPEVVEFDGFINYGSPILGPTFVPLAVNPIQTSVLTPNVINQPIFSTRKVTTSVSIWDGQTVALGGLIREDVQKVEDKVPILGDIPLAGRLFRSNVDQKIKRNLIIFVTARLMDAEGRPVRRDDEQEEIVEPLGLPENLPPPAVEQRSFGK
ncbi:MAG: Amuc_1098 family type IV pilus outer membrane protein [Terrimicrobiaceae bacterium]|nr:Amuc_1098 family type IV pilus outer membrane protein [Terrimicrobiaceae bacterium]